ncbi:ABC transporter permease [Marinicrinis lubricantis]|uniref:ABC transporter permease n=1 Tax=Marinicrinis lubricantis TaxID=2086470 RepID=A0ABW1IML6_9BACL
MNKGKWLAVPALTWLILFFAAPLLMIALYSFFQRGLYGELVYEWTIHNYTRLFDSLYGKIMLDTLVVSFLTTFLTLMIAYPLAYYIAGLKPHKQKIWLLLMMLPFWINFLIRSYAWVVILRSQGIVNMVLMHFGWIEEPLQLLYNNGAVMLGMVYTLLPFMVLPIYVTLEKLERNKLEAAYDLGATPWKAFLHVTLPLTKSGIINGCVIVFVSSIGMFIVPDVMGGAKTMLLGNLIQNQFLSARDWPFGSAASMVLMVLSLVLLYWQYRAGKVKNGQEVLKL